MTAKSVLVSSIVESAFPACEPVDLSLLRAVSIDFSFHVASELPALLWTRGKTLVMLPPSERLSELFSTPSFTSATFASNSTSHTVSPQHY